MKLSKRASSVAPSATIAITAQAAQMLADGIDVVSFGAGEPDFDTPQLVKDAAVAAMQAGDTKYTPRTAGQLRQAIADKLALENDIHVQSDQVLVTFGGKNALYMACQALIEPGQKVLIPVPYWNSYPEMVRLAGGEPVFLPTSPADNFKITPEQILKASQGANAIIINSPANPTGTTYTPEELSDIAQAVLKTDLSVFSDEIYEKLIYGSSKFVSFAALDDKLPQRTLTFNGLSKTFCMTGWRLGWVAGPPETIGAMKRLMSHATTNPVSFAQAGALAAYKSPDAPKIIETMRKEFDKRGRHMTERLNAINGITCPQPDGAFYCFCDVSNLYGRKIGQTTLRDSSSFAKAALESAEVALVPGTAFGEDRCVRLSFATSMSQIDKGLDRLEKMLK